MNPEFKIDRSGVENPVGDIYSRSELEDFCNQVMIKNSTLDVDCDAIHKRSMRIALPIFFICIVIGVVISQFGGVAEEMGSIPFAIFAAAAINIFEHKSFKQQKALIEGQATAIIANIDKERERFNSIARNLRVGTGGSYFVFEANRSDR